MNRFGPACRAVNEETASLTTPTINVRQAPGQPAQLLYSCTVLVDAYLLRFRGEKLPPGEVRRRVRRGWLELAKRVDGAPERVATLRSERGGLTGELHCASVTRITSEGLLVVGWEPPQRIRQAWWCVPVITRDV